MDKPPALREPEKSEQANIEAIWKQVQDKVNQLAGGAKAAVKNLTVDEVLQLLDSHQTSAQQDKFPRLKNAVTKTLKCIEAIGGVVSSATSSVFAPSTMCFNALTFVIQVWRGYEGMSENLAELLEKCAEFLNRLPYYPPNMDLRLAHLACQNLQLFIEICDRIIQLRGKPARFRAFSRKLFLNDSGVQALLNFMDKLNSKEALLVAAQTFKVVSNSAGDLQIIVHDHGEQKKTQDAKDRRKAIAEALGFGSSELDPALEPIYVWQRRFDTHQNAIIDGTGDWLSDIGPFVDWAKAKSPAKRVIVLQGNKGSGKTMLMTNVLRYLRRNNQTGPTTRAVTAYFFPEDGSRKLSAGDRDSFPEQASRALLWQLCVSFEAMTRSVGNLIQESAGFAGSLDLWQQLYLENPDRLNSHTTFFILIDGLDADVSVFLPLIQRLVSATAGRGTRLLLTASPEATLECARRVGSGLLEIIPLGNRNKHDVEKFINHRMDNIPMLSNPNCIGITQWRRKILEELSAKCGGDYFKLNTNLSAISHMDLVEDIKEVLANADKTRADRIDAEIRFLNQDRTAKEIQEINHIILWVEAGRDLFSVDTLEALLIIMRRVGASATSLEVENLSGSSSGEEGAVSLNVSLLPLRENLVNRYLLFTVTDENYVTWRTPEVSDRIPRKNAIAATSSTRPQIIQKAEIAIVQHFLNNVCHGDLYKRFEFDRFFESKLDARGKGYICIDPRNAHARAAIAYLTILTERVITDNEDLLSHARCDLLFHLKKVDLLAADRTLKAQAGQLLVRLLTSETGVASLFLPCESSTHWMWKQRERMQLGNIRVQWIYSFEGVREVARWMNDRSAIMLIRDDAGKDFVEAVKNATDSFLHKTVLAPAAEHLARRMYYGQPDLPMLQAALRILRGYLIFCAPEAATARVGDAPLDPNTLSTGSSLEYLEEARNFEVAIVDAIESRASVALNKADNNAIQDSNWESQAITILVSACPSLHAELVVPRALKAIKLNPKNVHVRLLLALRAGLGNDEAIAELSELKYDLESMDGDGPRVLLGRTTLELGNRLWDSGENRDVAVHTHLSSLSYGYSGHGYNGVLQRYIDDDEPNRLIAFIDALINNAELWAPRVDMLINDLNGWLCEERIVAHAADATDRWDLIERFYDLVIDLCEKVGDHDLLLYLRRCIGNNLEKSAVKATRVRRVGYFEAALKHHVANQEYSSVLSLLHINRLVSDLSAAYLEEALATGDNPETTDAYVGKITRLLGMADDGAGLMSAMAPTCFLICHERKTGRRSELVSRWTSRLILESLELLSDDDDENNLDAYLHLMNLMVALQDVENCRIATHLWKQELAVKMNKGLLETAQNEERGIDIASSFAEVADGLESDFPEAADDSDVESGQAVSAERREGAAVTAVVGMKDSTVEKGQHSPENDRHGLETHHQDPDGRNSVCSRAQTDMSLEVRGVENEHESDNPADTRPAGDSNVSSNETADGTGDSNDDSSSDDTTYDFPDAPWYVICIGCTPKRSFLKEDVPTWVCMDCVRLTVLGKSCYEQWKRESELEKQSNLLKRGCAPEHRFIFTPPCSGAFEGVRDRVPLMSKPEREDGEVEIVGWGPAKEWKNRLRSLYL